VQCLKRMAVDRKTIRELDRIAVERFTVPSIILMENAGRGAAEIIAEKYPFRARLKVLVVAGKGNNAGDGFVVARHLSNKGYAVRVATLAKKEKYRGDAQTNLRVLFRLGVPVKDCTGPASSATLLKELEDASLVVDAIFGTGLSGDVRPPMRDAIEAINSSQKPIVSLDIPSGLDADSGLVLGSAVRATHTITFALPKKGFFIGEGPEYTGELHLCDIGIAAERLLAGEELGLA